MENYKLESVHFKKLKGLEDVKIEFKKPLTAIMGVNGSGKTTVIHALACIYQPIDETHGENHKFPEFFVPNTDALWTGSELHVVNRCNDKVLPSRQYEKKFDRWSPRYSSRPKRCVYYIGIDTCLPEVEKNTPQSRVMYSSVFKDDKTSNNVISKAASVLNKDYDSLLDNTYQNKHFSGVKLRSGLKYSSLSMGTGEQRIIKIFEKVLNAEAYSLILIDEIDLLLHISALRKLIKELYEIAVKRHLQIIFTTHSLVMSELTEYVGIQYIDIQKSDNKNIFFVYDKISPDLIYHLDGSYTRPLRIYVEDNVAKSIIQVILQKTGMSSKTDVIKIGSISNVFTIAAAAILTRSNHENTLIVTDGDRYRETREKVELIKKVLTGNEEGREEQRKKAVSLIKEFNLPENTKPEEFLKDIYLKYGNRQSELYEAMQRTEAVGDSHEWIYNVSAFLNIDVEQIVRDIALCAYDNPEWKNYIAQIVEWLDARKDI